MSVVFNHLIHSPLILFEPKGLNADLTLSLVVFDIPVLNKLYNVILSESSTI